MDQLSDSRRPQDRLSAELSDLAWRKSTRSNFSGNCLEAAPAPGGLAVRDSKDKSGPVLLFRADMWQTFVEGVKDGGLR